MTNAQLEAEIEHLLELIAQLRQEMNELTKTVNMLSIQSSKNIEHIGYWMETLI